MSICQRFALYLQICALSAVERRDGASKIAFADITCPFCDRAIYKMRARGETVNELGVGSDPIWSAKGKLAFVRRIVQGEADI